MEGKQKPKGDSSGRLTLGPVFVGNNYRDMFPTNKIVFRLT